MGVGASQHKTTMKKQYYHRRCYQVKQDRDAHKLTSGLVTVVLPEFMDYLRIQEEEKTRVARQAELEATAELERLAALLSVGVHKTTPRTSTSTSSGPRWGRSRTDSRKRPCWPGRKRRRRSSRSSPSRCGRSTRIPPRGIHTGRPMVSPRRGTNPRPGVSVPTNSRTAHPFSKFFVLLLLLWRRRFATREKLSAEEEESDDKPNRLNSMHNYILHCILYIYIP